MCLVFLSETLYRRTTGVHLRGFIGRKLSIVKGQRRHLFVRQNYTILPGPPDERRLKTKRRLKPRGLY